jgi:ferredoxin/coenzyme F420-reducing hydrogenase delta subunit
MSEPTTRGGAVPQGHTGGIELEVSDLKDLLPREAALQGGGKMVDLPVRGERILAWFERLFLRLDLVLSRVMPKELNPFLQTGAIALVSFLIATGTGVLLLFWYSPSVVQAYSSVASMDASRWTGGMVRSLHRYSSDLCLFFTLVHAVRLFVERRFTGARWLPWVTGIFMMGIVWFLGWTGYWLVWDERAQHIGVGTAKMLDVLPVFADPMGRSFLVDDTVNSLLFFVIFFAHMMIPLIFAVGTWLHLGRISRPRFLTGKPMTIWLVGVLLAMSIFYPAASAGPASMREVGQSFTMDWWYLMPVAVADRLEGGALWGILFVASCVTISIPWVLGRGRTRKAEVILSRCDACTKCYHDCPYNAISMVPRTDEMKDRFDTQAEVDPNLCVGCGICAGSCDTSGNGIQWFDPIEKRKLMRGWVSEMLEAGAKPYVALVCEHSAGADLRVDGASGICEEMPGYRVLKVPCAGWINPLTYEGLLRKDAAGVLVVSCGPGECHYREGAEWTRQRLNGERQPSLRKEHADREKILLLGLGATSKRELMNRAAAFCGGETPRPQAAPSKVLSGIAAVVVGLIVATVVGVGSDFSYAAPGSEESVLVVTFRHPGQRSETVRILTPEELAELPAHMRQKEVRERGRSSVRLRIRVDGELIQEESFAAKGLWADGPSVAMEAFPIEPGRHEVEVSLGDGADEEEWQYVETREMEFDRETRRVVIFDRGSGFSWH